MIHVKETLSSKLYFVDNKYLDMYARLVERNTRTPVLHGVTNKHHILPKSWFKMNKLPVDNSLSNLVNLVYRDHVLAHYYLCLCTTDELQYANQLALVCLVSRKKLNSVDKQLVTTLPLYKNIYEAYTKNRQNGMQLYKEDLD